MNRYKKSLRILKDEGVIALTKKIFHHLRDGSNAGKYINDPVKTNRWRRLKDIYKGERAFLIGNGPSLNRTPMHLLANEFTICFNRFNLMFERLAWKPTMYMCVDERVAEDNATEINEIIPQVKYAFFPDIHCYGMDFREFINDADNVFWLSLVLDGFFQDLPHVGLGGTVANVGLQVLSFMGFSPIYLVGVDMNYKDHKTVIKHDKRNWTSIKDDDPNHFDPRYFGKGRKYHYPRLNENMLPSLERAKIITDNMNIQVINAGIGGCLEIFSRVNFRSLFKYSYEEELRLLFGSCPFFDKNQRYSTLGDAFPEAMVLDTDAWNPQLSTIITSIELAEKLIPKAIFTHIPYGPIENRYIFIKRSTK